MIKKVTSPILSEDGKKVDGTKVEYRLLGILLYKKVLINPEASGIEYYTYQTRI